MTKIQNPIVGRARGSAGGMTFAKNYDKNVMRSKPFEVKNPKTQGQTTQRNFFKEVQDICASVSKEELRSLFCDMPKGMSRRNALSNQIAAAYSVNGSTKSVDFSKLQAIGNGLKVNTPIIPVVSGWGVKEVEFSSSQFEGYKPGITNIIWVFFDTTANQIRIINSNLILRENQSLLGDDFHSPDDHFGFVYPTMSQNGDNVYHRGFGSFIIKTRAEKTGRTINKGSVQPGNIVTLSGTTADSTATLNFANYNFNNLVPGTLVQGEGLEVEQLVPYDDWESTGENNFVGELASNYDPTKPTYLQILQNSLVVESVPFNVVME